MKVTTDSVCHDQDYRYVVHDQNNSEYVCGPCVASLHGCEECDEEEVSPVYADNDGWLASHDLSHLNQTIREGVSCLSGWEILHEVKNKERTSFDMGDHRCFDNEVILALWDRGKCWADEILKHQNKDGDYKLCACICTPCIPEEDD
jgi:hypothetical protein